MFVTELVVRLPDGWRLGMDKLAWVLEIPDDGDLVEVGRGNDPLEAIAAALLASYTCPADRCIEPRPVDQTAAHTHRLRPKSVMELLWEACLPSWQTPPIGRGLTIHFPIFESLEPSTPRPTEITVTRQEYGIADADADSH